MTDFAKMEPWNVLHAAADDLDALAADPRFYYSDAEWITPDDANDPEGRVAVSIAGAFISRSLGVGDRNAEAGKFIHERDLHYRILMLAQIEQGGFRIAVRMGGGTPQDADASHSALSFPKKLGTLTEAATACRTAAMDLQQFLRDRRAA
ncbi:MAG: hypothetical protein ACE37J_11870 [Pikeienuella sp.]|uniref:hypothetical protein n=1 Tax=Pikeienuella sp. TaxID=2831957 RepID=UPI003919E724